MEKIQQVPFDQLRPTQLTIGMIEVEEKRKNLAALSRKAQQDFLQAHPMPAVIGPHKVFYITDHHHLARAAVQAKIDAGYVTVDDDLSQLDLPAFWERMNEEQWVHPLDHNGVRHLYSALPARIEDLVDDVYRSLAGFVRDAGGYDKTRTAFAEFIWADFFRRNVPIEDVTRDFQGAVREAKSLARSSLAKHIPGFKG